MSWEGLCKDHKVIAFSRAIEHVVLNPEPHLGARLIIDGAIQEMKSKKPVKHPSKDECWMCKEQE